MTVAVLAIFVLSGAAGLIYEVVWARELVLVFGNTTQAVSAILTGFFGGLAIGSGLGGRFADRVRRPLRMYGLLELILVAVVLVTPITFRLVHEVYRGAFGALEANPTVLALVRFGLALLALGPATVLMGATLPTLTRYLTRDRHLSRAFGRLYAANTFGAIIGTALAGFVLIELLGLSGTVLAGAICSGAAGLAALVLDRRAGVPEDDLAATAPALESGPPAGPPVAQPVGRGTDGAAVARPALALGVAFVSGLTSLAYQTLWTRLLASGTGNSTYVFSTILTIFLVGLALGAVAFTIIRPRLRNPAALLAVAQVVVAILAIYGLSRISGLGRVHPFDLPNHIGQLWTLFAKPVLLVVLPTTFVLGISFPAASALLSGAGGRTASSAGALLAVNTAGAIVGTFVVPFVVIPLIGSPAALALVAIINAVTGVVLALASRRWILPIRAATAVGGVAVALAIAVGLQGGAWPDPGAAAIVKAGGTVYQSREDEIASVQAGALGPPQVWVTGTSMTVMTVDTHLMPILPLALRPQSKTALTVAFGMGTAFRTALVAGLRTDVVELVPSVPLMFRWFYPDAASVLADPNGRVIIADGRNHVDMTDRHYDIIVTDPPPPIEAAGVSVISSLEYYQAGLDRLNPGGVMMQWMPTDQTLDEFKAQVRTFAAVFPNVIVAFGPARHGFYMLGSAQPISFDPDALRSVLERPGVLADISSAPDSGRTTLDDWMAFIPSLVWLSGDQVRAFVGDGPLITDDRPLPEYFLLRRLFGPKSPPVSPALLRSLTPPG